MKKLIAMILIFMYFLPAGTAYAEYVLDSNWNYVLSEDSYTDDGKIKVFSLWHRYSGGTKLAMELPKIDLSIPKLTFIGADDKMVDGLVTYPNYDDIVPGFFDLQWIFTPNDNKYETISGTLRFEVFPEDTDEMKGVIKREPEESDEPTTPSLTASTVLLTNDTAYDINLNNKIAGSSYKWTSSDAKVAKVNSKNGLVTAVSEGIATITCEITPPEGDLIKLKSIVTIGYDDNAPILSDTSLDLGVGDKYTIKAENTLEKSNIRFASSDKSIIKVGTANGKVTAVSAGNAYITCTITAGGQVIVLRCDISVE